MLDEKDLQAIENLVDQRISASEVRMTETLTGTLTEMMDEKIQASEVRMGEMMDEKIRASESRMMAMMESLFMPQCNLLAEKMDALEQKVVRREEHERVEARVDVLEAVVKVHSIEIERLKKAE
ncbi:MAG: hypothetical protein HFF90_02180 [Oscillibacter sp.]|nr:hypothetical protein [Oscillibacter sp.]